MMIRLKKLAALASIGATLAVTAAVGIALPANAEPTGQYTYTCAPAGDGNVYTVTKAAAKKCSGWVDIYISGKHVGHIHPGPLAKNPKECAFHTVAGAVELVLVFSGQEEGWVDLVNEAIEVGINCTGKVKK
jgi:hypothetical protein